MSRRTHERRLAILGSVRCRGGATPDQIEKDLGPEWEESRKRNVLQKTLRRMVNKHVLMKDGHGRYIEPPNGGWRGLDAFHSAEEDIARFMRSRGCGVRTSEIHREFGTAVAADEQRPYEYRLVHRVLRESKRFEKVDHGLWSLAEEEMEELPIAGKFLSRQIALGARNESDWLEERAARFDDIGSAFMDARGDWDIPDVVADPAIRLALLEMSREAKIARARALEELRAEMEGRAAKEGSTSAFYIESLIREHKTERLLESIYAQFELGEASVHLIAPVGFCVSCAALFGVCPAKLSRGVVARVPARAATA